MMSNDERNIPDWDPDVEEGGKLLSDVAIGKSMPGGSVHSSKTTSPPQSVAMCGLLSIDFYRPYFDVDTSQVKTRLFQATWPKAQGPPFLDDTDAAPAMPDMYGPVWVSATMVFVLSVVFDLRSGPMSSQLDEVWRSIYFVLEYLIIGSLGLWMFFRSQNVRLTPPEAISVYGYSLTSFVLATPLCLLAWPIRWIGLAVASAFAANFVLRSSLPRLQETAPEKMTTALLCGVSVFHFIWFVYLALS